MKWLHPKQFKRGPHTATMMLLFLVWAGNIFAVEGLRQIAVARIVTGWQWNP